jgi:hypothetical protein
VQASTLADFGAAVDELARIIGSPGVMQDPGEFLHRLHLAEVGGSCS